jgi:hypothetical protein
VNDSDIAFGRVHHVMLLKRGRQRAGDALFGTQND